MNEALEVTAEVTRLRRLLSDAIDTLANPDLSGYARSRLAEQLRATIGGTQ